MEDDINKIDDEGDLMYEDYLYDDRSGCSKTFFIILFVITTIYMIIKLFNTEHL